MSTREESRSREQNQRAVDEACKFRDELEQALQCGSQVETPRRASLKWRLNHILFYITVLSQLPGALAMVSPQEQWANAVSTLIWTCACALVLYMCGTIAKKLGEIVGSAIMLLAGGINTSLVQTCGALSQAITLVSTSFSGTLNALNIKLGALVDAYIEYLQWMKIIHLVTAVANGANSLINLIRLPFSLFASPVSSPFVPMSPQGKDDFTPEGASHAGNKFNVQDVNKYGFLLSTILATCMFILGPVWGLSKSYKCFETPMRMLERLPYVTWLIDFVKKWSAGEASMSDIPEDVSDFAAGKEERKRQPGLYNWGSGVSHLVMELDLEACGNDVRILGRCGDGKCYCKCHIKEEVLDAKAVITEIDTVGGAGVVEGTAGLGHKSRAYLDRNRMTFVSSVEEPIESRKERLSAEEQRCEKCNGDSKGKKICFDCYKLVDEKGKEKEEPIEDVIQKLETPVISQAIVDLMPKGKFCTGCGGILDPFQISKCKECLKEQKTSALANQGVLGYSWVGWTRERALWEISKVMGAEAADYVYSRIKQAAEHVNAHKLTYMAAAMTVVSVWFATRTYEPKFFSESSSKNRSRVVMAPKQYVGRRHSTKKLDHVVSGGEEQDLEQQDLARERQEREQEEFERAQDLQDKYEEYADTRSERRRQMERSTSTFEPKQVRKNQDWADAASDEEGEQLECVHFSSCPTMPLVIDAKHECHTACGGHHCAHFATCVPKTEKKEGLPAKLKELKMKHFPVARKPVQVARAARIIRKAKTTGKYFTRQEHEQHLAARRINRVNMTEESLLGKTRSVHQQFASHVFKVLYDGQMTSTGTVVADKVVVPLHSHIDGVVGISNATASAILTGEIIPIADDLGIFFHRGAVRCASGWRMEVPTNGIAIQLGYKAQSEVEPSHGVGFYSSNGLYDAPTEAGNCGGPVISCTSGALIGFHIAGSDNVNRFVPLTVDMINKLKMNEKDVLASMLFQ